MKETIKNLKKLTGHRSDVAFAEFVGVSKSTVHLAKKGKKTKLNAVLPMLEYLLSGLSQAKLKDFLKEFK